MIQKIKTDLIPAISLCLDKRYQSLQEPVIQAKRIADHSTWDLEDPNSGKAWVLTLADHFRVTLSHHNFSLDLALKELNTVKALQATKFQGYKGFESLWEIFESFQDRFPHFLLIIELCLCVILILLHRSGIFPLPEAPPWGFVYMCWPHQGAFATNKKKKRQMPNKCLKKAWGVGGGGGWVGCMCLEFAEPLKY